MPVGFNTNNTPDEKSGVYLFLSSYKNLKLLWMPEQDIMYSSHYIEVIKCIVFIWLQLICSRAF